MSNEANGCCKRSILRELMMKIGQEAGSGSGVLEAIGDKSKYVQLIKKWNTIAGNGPLKIGARTIEFGNVQEGNLLCPGDRTFISGPLDADEVTMKIKKSANGKGICEVCICKVGAGGEVTNLAKHTFPADAPVGAEFSKTFTGLKGHALEVFLNGKGGIGKRFPLQFIATKQEAEAA